MKTQKFLQAQLPKDLSFAKLDNKLDETEHFGSSRVLQCAQRGIPVSDAVTDLTGRNRSVDVTVYAASEYSSVVAFVLSFPLVESVAEPMLAYFTPFIPVETISPP